MAGAGRFDSVDEGKRVVDELMIWHEADEDRFEGCASKKPFGRDGQRLR